MAEPHDAAGVVLGFAACPRYLGAAVVHPGQRPSLEATRIRCHGWERKERARVGAWAERLMLGLDRPIVVVVALDTDSEHLRSLNAIVLAAAARNELPAVEVTYLEVVRAVGASSSLMAAVCTRLREQHPAVAEELRRRGVWTFLGPRSEAARYWTMPLIAYGAALHAYDFIVTSVPQ
jgi:hypothetical protein